MAYRVTESLDTSPLIKAMQYEEKKQKRRQKSQGQPLFLLLGVCSGISFVF